MPEKKNSAVESAPVSVSKKAPEVEEPKPVEVPKADPAPTPVPKAAPAPTPVPKAAPTPAPKRTPASVGIRTCAATKCAKRADPPIVRLGSDGRAGSAWKEVHYCCRDCLVAHARNGFLTKPKI